MNAMKQHCKGVVKRHPLQTAGASDADAPVCEIRLTRFTSTVPAAVTKALSPNEAGELVKRTPPQMSRGIAEVVTLRGIADLVTLLPALEPSQTLAYGIPQAPGERFEVFSSKALPEAHTAQQIARTRAFFTWPDGPGVLMLDYDPAGGAQALSRDALLAALDQAVPALATVARVWYPSASSCIWRGETEIAGIKGQRVYLAVTDAGDIERAGKVLSERLWLAGHGRFEVSKSGALLPRTLLDTTVWQANRLDFAAGAVCTAPLEQRRGEPFLIPGAAQMLDTREALPDLTAAETTALEDVQKRARAAVAGEADEVRRAYVLEMANEIAAGDPERFTAARVVAEHAIMNLRLMGDFPLVLDDGKAPTVGDVLDDREKYHGRLTLDPLEPDYDGGRIVGKLFLIGGRPNLHSFAHGGRTFKLVRAPRRVESVAGKTSDLIDRTLSALRGAPDIFDLGDAAAAIADGRVLPLVDSTLGYLIGHELQFWCRKKTPAGVEYEADLDPPPKVLRALLDMGRTRGLRPLDAVITAPTIRPDGSVLDQPGYDARTRLFFDACGRTVPVIPAAPTAEQSADALERLMHPFAEFPLATTLDRSVLLAALLTAAIRPAAPTAPGFAFDAPTQGSGKTLLARCVGILAGGAEPSIWPHVMASRDADAEIRKRLLASLLKGDASILWDNVIGKFDSASIATFLTAPAFTDRVLGQSRDATVPNRALFLASGNNLLLAGELPRRFLTCRIDPETERPFARRFRLDPAAHCLQHRQRMIGAALIVVRAWMTSEDCRAGRRAPGAMASFEQWDELVRQPVAWLARTAPALWRDPFESITAATAEDPEVEQLVALLEALHRRFGAERFTSGDVLRDINSTFCLDDETSIAAAVEDIAGRAGLSSKTIGRVLLYRKDRRAGGKVLRTTGMNRDKKRVWHVETF